jgi:cytochrome c2
MRWELAGKMRIIFALFVFVCVFGCAPKKMVQGNGIEFQGIMVDTITTPKKMVQGNGIEFQGIMVDTITAPKEKIHE